MFKFLKDKLKGALNIFSKKVEEEGKTIEEEVVVEPKKTAPKKTDNKASKVDEKKKPSNKVEVAKQQKPTETVSQTKPSQTHDTKKSHKHTEQKTPVKPEKVKKTHTSEESEQTPQKETTQPESDSIIVDKEEQNQPIIETQKQKDSAETEEKPAEKKKSFFGKIASVFSKKEEVVEQPVETIEQIQPPHVTAEEISESPRQEVAEEEPVVEEKKGFFASIGERITKKKISQEQFEELFFELELILLENNVAVQVIEKIKADLSKKLVDTPIKRSEILETIQSSLKESIDDVLNFKTPNILKMSEQKKPYIIAFIGVNGAGKTTTLAKVAHYFQKHNKSVVIAACDTFRAAAIHQLEEHANKLKVKIIKHDYGSDATAVAFDAVAHAKSKNIDVVLIDTAGRLHSNSNLMDELAKIERVIKPDLKLFVGESITGNDCVEQATQFNEKIGIDGIILSKADVDEKGGAAISVSYVTQKPIYFIGTGQTYDDLEPFDKEKILASLEL